MHQNEDITNPPVGGSPIIQPIKSAHEVLSVYLSQVAESQDKDAFTKLFEFFAPKIKRFGIKQFKDDSLANELVQDTMANVWRKSHLYNKDKGAATTWVYTVMRNVCFDHQRKMKNNAAQNLGDDIWPLEQASVERDTTYQQDSDHLMNEKIQKLVDELPTAQRVVLKAVYYQDLSQEQLAQQLGVPVGTIKSRLRLALSKIRQKMGEQNHD
ncbi:sigma-70 family RNA polymerase sigma factor [Vibrio sp. ZSDE26]|uniref:Sigma-70 family RNA polymerase sigma factor n=1 Tax=Vibrio amylolyticus TaxID=2847292 RepID=A0A9X1XLU9_9VIBR|nr:sigma-70 family RNA polymerase sigma factor [Vibrio amylolyticus]MCK6264213.1 sigma-70 family RNA polymerase sigma factor [Vibrio amylolyticus]